MDELLPLIPEGASQISNNLSVIQMYRNLLFNLLIHNNVMLLVKTKRQKHESPSHPTGLAVE